MNAYNVLTFISTRNGNIYEWGINKNDLFTDKPKLFQQIKQRFIKIESGIINMVNVE